MAPNPVCLKLMDRTELDYQRTREKNWVFAIRGRTPLVDSVRGRAGPRDTQDEAGTRLCVLLSLGSSATQTSTHWPCTLYHLFFNETVFTEVPGAFLSLNSRGSLQSLLSLMLEHLSPLTTQFVRQPQDWLLRCPSFVLF